MKNLILILSVIVSLFSCKKEEPIQPVNIINNPSSNTIIKDIDWVLQEGKVYVTNLYDNTEKVYYDHFSSSRSVSNLSIFEPIFNDFDSIVKDYTTWRITNKTFIINGNEYGYSYSDYTQTYKVFQLVNGKPIPSRNIEIESINESRLSVKVNESNESNNGINYNYSSHLTFKKKGISNVEPLKANPYFVYKGVLSTSTTTTSNTSTIFDQVWVVLKVTQSFPNQITTTLEDTLEFTSVKQGPYNYILKINGKEKENSTDIYPYNYRVTQDLGSNNKKLDIVGGYTFGTGVWTVIYKDFPVGQTTTMNIEDWSTQKGKGQIEVKRIK